MLHHSLYPSALITLIPVHCCNSSRVRRDGRMRKLKRAEAKSIVVTEEDMNKAVTNVDLSIAVDPIARSKSWSEARSLHKILSELTPTGPV